MTLQSVGTAVGQRLVFNSGYLTFGSSQMIDISTISINATFDIKAIKALNTIKKRAQKRANFQVEASFTAVGNNITKINQLFFSSSSPVANGLDYTIKDGQQDSTTMYITCYIDDDTTKPIQYQLSNAIISSNGNTLATEEFDEQQFTVMATDMVLFEDSDAAN